MTIGLDEAIKIHIGNERKELNPTFNAVVIRNAEIHIRVFETAPRNSASLQHRIAQTRRKMQTSRTIEQTDILYAELQAYERLLGMVRAAEAGRPLDGLAY